MLKISVVLTLLITFMVGCVSGQAVHYQRNDPLRATPTQSRTSSAQYRPNTPEAAAFNGKIDAETDTNKATWCLVGATPVILVAAITVPTSINAPYGEYGAAEFRLRFNCISPLIGTLGAVFSPASPPAERLIGKSPEYVSAYTDAYKSKTRSIRTKSALIGAATGCGISIVGSVIYVISSSDFSLGPTF